MNLQGKIKQKKRRQEEEVFRVQLEKEENKLDTVLLLTLIVISMASFLCLMNVFQ